MNISIHRSDEQLPSNLGIFLPYHQSLMSLEQHEGNTLDIFNFSSEEVQEKLQHLNIYKSTGPDMLHPQILFALEDKLARPVAHIFNNSVLAGNIPEDWKSANVTAIHKK